MCRIRSWQTSKAGARPPRTGTPGIPTLDRRPSSGAASRSSSRRSGTCTRRGACSDSIMRDAEPGVRRPLRRTMMNRARWKMPPRNQFASSSAGNTTAVGGPTSSPCPVMAYGASREAAITAVRMLAFRVAADCIDHARKLLGPEDLQTAPRLCKTEPSLSPMPAPLHVKWTFLPLTFLRRGEQCLENH